MPPCPRGSDANPRLTAVPTVRPSATRRRRATRTAVALAAALAALLALRSAEAGAARTESRRSPADRAPASSDRSEWTIERRPDGRLQVKLERRRDDGENHSTTSWSFEAEPKDFRDLRDLDAEGPVQFRLVRESGAFIFEGRIGHGKARGGFVFEPNEGFRQMLRRAVAGEITDADLERLAMHDVRFATVKALRDHGYTGLEVDDLVRLSVHGASPEFVGDMMKAGYAGLTVDDLVRLRVHDVSPELVREYAALGYDHPSVDDLIRLKVHGAEPSYVRELRVMKPNPTVDDLVRMRVHGVDADFVRAFIALGFDGITADDLVRFRTHGVSPGFARRALADHPGLSPDELVRLRVSGRR